MLAPALLLMLAVTLTPVHEEHKPAAVDYERTGRVVERDLCPALRWIDPDDRATLLTAAAGARRVRCGTKRIHLRDLRCATAAFHVLPYVGFGIETSISPPSPL